MAGAGGEAAGEAAAAAKPSGAPVGEVASESSGAATTDAARKSGDAGFATDSEARSPVGASSGEAAGKAATGAGTGTVRTPVGEAVTGSAEASAVEVENEATGANPAGWIAHEAARHTAGSNDADDRSETVGESARPVAAGASGETWQEDTAEGEAAGSGLSAAADSVESRLEACVKSASSESTGKSAGCADLAVGDARLLAYTSASVKSCPTFGGDRDEAASANRMAISRSSDGDSPTGFGEASPMCRAGGPLGSGLVSRAGNDGNESASTSGAAKSGAVTLPICGEGDAARLRDDIEGKGGAATCARSNGAACS